MGFLHTRRYVINVADEDELYAEAINRVDDPETAEYLENAAQEGWGGMAASTVLCSMADVGDATDIVRVLDEFFEPGRDVDMYFAPATTTHTPEGTVTT